MASKDGGGRMISRKSAKVDRISSLPDELLSQIISLLPTKCAVGTSILSTRWKCLWTCSIDSFDLKGPPKGSDVADFTSFVNHLFDSCTSSHIQKFTLHFWACFVDVSVWINEAIKRNVSELDLDVLGPPLSVFSCTTLTVLKISGVISIPTNISISFSLPCLKFLHAVHLGICDKGFMGKLIRSCPVLEDLILCGCLGGVGYYEGDTFTVSTPSLRTLSLQFCPSSCYLGATNISIESPNLEYLDLNDSFVNFNIEGDFSSLVMANISITDIRTCPLHNYGLLRKTNIYGSSLPKFRNLTSLKVIIRGHRFWKLIPQLFESSPSLKVLSLEQYERVREYNMAGPPAGEIHYTWVEAKSVAECLRYHLGVIKYEGFKGRKHELQLLKYCLGNAKVLQRVTIKCQGCKQAQEMQFSEQLLGFSRASRNCEIQFHGDFISSL